MILAVVLRQDRFQEIIAVSDVNIDELDASDLTDILTEVKGEATKVKNVASARKELAKLLDEKSMVLGTDDEGNFTITAKKPAKGKVKAKAPEPEPEEETEEPEEETEEEAEEEAEEEPEEEAEEEEPPPPKKKAKVAEPAPKSKVKAKAPEPEEEAEEEEAEEEAPKPKSKVKSTKAPAAEGTKRAPPPREPRYKPEQTISVLKKDAKFQEGTGRSKKWALMLKAKTVGGFLKAATDAELATPSGFLGHCVKEGYVKVT